MMGSKLLLDQTLFEAAQSGCITESKQCLAEGADVNATNASLKRTALHGAARDGHIRLIQCLLKSGIDIQCAHENGKTSLYHLVDYYRASNIKQRQGVQSVVGIDTLLCETSRFLISTASN